MSDTEKDTSTNLENTKTENIDSATFSSFAAISPEEMEKKLKENEQTALFTDTETKVEEPKPAPKKSFRATIWTYLLLLTFLTSTFCGIYLTVKPTPQKENTTTEKTEEDSSIASSLLKSSKKGIAWIKVRGVIAQDSNTSAFSRPSGASYIAKRIREAAESKNVKAIVLDINSPGGTVASVQNIYGEILNAKAKGKKVVALFRDVAASGGFYIAMAADKIIAEPGTITGSVGVIMQASNVEGLFNKIGVSISPITSGKHKDIGSSYRAMTAEEKAILQDMVDDTYGQFLEAVKTGRPNVTEEVIKEYTDGRVFTGKKAFELGFIDALGGEEDARLLAGELVGIKDPKIIGQRSSGAIRDMIVSFGSSMEENSLAKQLQSISTPSVSYLWIN